MKKTLRILIILILLLVLSPLYAIEDTLLMADVPIVYGEDNFIERIKERTGGEREPIGLVLSGGSARAFAHIGVLKYLEENDIVPDFIISNSMGSIIGLLYAAGYSPDQIYDFCSKTSLTSLFDLALPINSGILDVQKFLSYASKFIPEGTGIEDLDIPIMVVGEDLVSKRRVLITQGDFFEVFQASFALPFYFSSVGYGGHIIVDGGIANLVPLDLAYRYGNHNIVSTTFYNVDTLNLKNPLTSLNVSFDIGKRRQGVKDIMEHPDAVWIRCDVEDVSFMEFSKTSYLRSKGYESAILQKDELNDLVSQGHSSVTLAMTQKREELQKTLVKEQHKYSLYNHVSARKFTHILGLNGWTSAQDKNFFFISDSLGIGLSSGIRWKNLDFRATAGIESRATNNGWVFPGINIKTSLYLNRLRFLLASDYIFSFQTNAKFVGSIYANQAIEYKIFENNGYNLRLYESTEYIKDTENLRESFWKEGGLSSLFLNLNISKDDHNLNLITGPQFVWDKKSFRSFVFGKVEELYRIPKTQLYMQGSVVGRFALNSSDSAFLSINDGYITRNSLFLEAGVPNQLTGNRKNHLIIAGLEFGYKSDNTISFSELILMDNFKVCGFTNIIWFDGKNPLKPNFNFGLKISSDSPLIGLSTVPMEMVISFDTSDCEVFWGFTIGQ